MNILFDGRGTNWYKGTGIGTYTYNLLNYLLEMDKENTYSIFWSGLDYDEFQRQNSKIIMASKKHQRFFEDFYIPHYITKNNFDLYHIPQNGMGLKENIACKKVVTIHDLIPYILPETVGAGYLKRFLETMPYIIENSDAIITVSEYSKKDILKFFPTFDSKNIYVTPLATNSNFKVMDKESCFNKINKKFNIGNPYILYVGGFSERKNVKSLITAFKNVYSSLNQKYVLLIAGSLKDEGENLKNYCVENNLDHYIKFCGYIDDTELPVLYNGASAFVYPSLYEGFGLPPLEAMSCGTPVITSNTTSIPEVVTDCGILIDPTSEDSISSALESLLNNEDLLNSFSLKGINRSKEFSWLKTAELTLKAYSSLII